MHRVSPRITGVGNGTELSITVAETRVCANDFDCGGRILCVGGTAMEGGFTEDNNSVCQSKAMAGLTAVIVQTGSSKQSKTKAFFLKLYQPNLGGGS